MEMKGGSAVVSMRDGLGVQERRKRRFLPGRSVAFQGMSMSHMCTGLDLHVCPFMGSGAAQRMRPWDRLPRSRSLRALAAP
ncbi:hypothetical protein KH5H1_58850 [Corallococcus caeni]|nr:hypothetical protein KH5H1_58850 [Corallococcus sp. KH5-1]